MNVDSTKPSALTRRWTTVAGGKSADDVRHEFEIVVNMSPKELERWLATDESRSVGWGGEDSESVGHESGRKIVAIKRKAKDQLTEGDYDQMRKVIGSARRHLAQGGPDNDKEHSRWRYSLMNWGHDA